MGLSQLKTNLADFIFEVERYTTLRMIPVDTHYYRNRLLDMLPSAARISALKLTNLEKRLIPTTSREQLVTFVG